MLQAARPRFAFTDPPVRHSLPVTLALAAAAGRPAAVLTGPALPVTRSPRRAGPPAWSPDHHRQAARPHVSR